MILELILSVALITIVVILNLYIKKFKTSQIMLHDSRKKFSTLKTSFNSLEKNYLSVRDERNVTQQSLESLMLEHEDVKRERDEILLALKKFGWTTPKRGVMVIQRQSNE